MAVVKIGDESFSITEIPASDTQLVLKQKEILLGSVDLETLVTDLGRVGKFIRIAYNGVADDTDLQIKVRALGVDVTKLCDKSAITVASFKTASAGVLDQLESTYGFIMGGLENMALITLEAVSDVAKEMAIAADDLHKEFDAESVRVEEVHKTTMERKDTQEKRKEQMKQDAIDFEKKKEEAERKSKQAEEEFLKCEERYKSAEAVQLHESSDPLNVICNAIVTIFTGTNAAQKAREEKLKHLEDMNRQQQERSKALEEIADFTSKISQCEKDFELSEAAIGALHSAMGGLKKLSVVMMKTALFWKQVQVHCQALAQEKLQKMIATALTMDEDKRTLFWKNPAFQKGAIKYYAQWVALNDVCDIYMERIRVTQKNLYAYLVENPTREQSKANVRLLAREFTEELALEQKKIADNQSANNKKMAEIRAEEPEDNTSEE